MDTKWGERNVPRCTRGPFGNRPESQQSTLRSELGRRPTAPLVFLRISLPVSTFPTPNTA